MQSMREFDQLAGSFLFVTKTLAVKLSNGAFPVAGKAPPALAIPKAIMLTSSITLMIAKILLINIPPRRENMWTIITNDRVPIAIPTT